MPVTVKNEFEVIVDCESISESIVNGLKDKDEIPIDYWQGDMWQWLYPMTDLIFNLIVKKLGKQGYTYDKDNQILTRPNFDKLVYDKEMEILECIEKSGLDVDYEVTYDDVAEKYAYNFDIALYGTEEEREKMIMKLCDIEDIGVSSHEDAVGFDERFYDDEYEQLYIFIDFRELFGDD